MKDSGQPYIPTGTRVRLKARTVFGWKGTATMLSFGDAIKDGSDDPLFGGVLATKDQWAVMRDQTANPLHENALRSIREDASGAKE